MEFPSLSDNYSDLLHIGSFAQKWQKALKDEENSLHGKEVERSKVAEYLGESEEVITELEECCKILSESITRTTSRLNCSKDAIREASLVCPAEKELGDLEFVPLKNGIPAKDVFLETLRIRCIAYKRFPAAPSQVYVTPKYAKGNYEMEYNHLKSGLQRDSASVQSFKVLLQAIIFKPFKGFAGSTEPWRERDLWKERELLILSDQRLTELKDKIICGADDALVSSDISEDPDRGGIERAQDVYPSNFFFFENTFYVDLRNPLATDISSPIREWLKSRGDKVSGVSTNDLAVKPMSDVTFDDLHVRLGFPYLYCHQGDCEHLVVFSDIRLMHEDDCQDLSKYPLMINKPPKKKLLCMICKLFTSKWMTKSDSFTPSDPSYQCDTCFRMLHYDKYGHKLGSFEAYPYIDAAIFS